MDVSNVTINHTMHCSECMTFAEELLEVILSDLGEKQLLWKKLEDLAKHHSSCHVRLVNGAHVDSCSWGVSIMIIKKLVEKAIISYSIVNSTVLISTEGGNTNEADAQETSGMKLLTEICNAIGYIFFKEMVIKRSRFSLKCYVQNGFYISYSKENEILRNFIALLGKSKYMKLLANLRLLSRLKNFDGVIHLAVINILKSLLSSIDRDFHGSGWQFEAIVCDLFNSRFQDKELIRIYLTTIAVQAIQLKLVDKKENEANEYIYCLRMYFSITGDTYLTLSEVRKMLYACLYVLEKLHLFESFYIEFVKMMPECSVKFEHWTLTDLLRYRIRNEFIKFYIPLPEAVGKLNLAQPLKEFLLGNMLQMSRKSADDSSEQPITKSKLDELVQQTIHSSSFQHFVNLEA